MIKKLLCAACLAPGIVKAEFHDELTDIIPSVECYKRIDDDRCVDVTWIHCNEKLPVLVETYGAVVASFCEDLKYQEDKIRALRIKLRHERLNH